MFELSSDTIQRIQDAQRVLLAPLQYETPEAWLHDAARRVQAVMGADHAYAFLPAKQRMVIAGSDLDPAFFEALRASFQGLQDGRLLLDDPMPMQMHLQRMKGGAGVYHELDLADRSTIEESPAHQTLFAPHGVEYATGMSVPLPIGEGALTVGFESPEAPGYDASAGQRLQLLIPAFEAGVEQWRRLAPLQSRFASLIDTISDAVVIVDADGTERYANRAFRSLLAAEPEAETLRAAAGALAAASRAAEGLVAVQREVGLAGGTYRLRVGRLPPNLPVRPGTLVVVERQSPYPPPAVLQEQFGLSPRESEVALQLARGLSDQEIADALFISRHTVRHHVQRVLRTLGLSSRAGVAHALLHPSEE